MNDTERDFWVAWSRIPGVGGVLLRRIQEHFGTLSSAWSASPGELTAIEGLGDRKIEAIVSGRSQLNLAEFVEQHQRQNPHFWTLGDDDYPQRLRDIPSPPPVLYYRGQLQPDLDWASAPAIAIVGTRHPSEYGKKWTRRLTTALVQHGFTIVSGMAAGIDTEAHQACLQAEGQTLAVLGTGVDVVYPPANRSLYEHILARGLVVSEYPAGTAPDRVHFPQRNRIIAGLSQATIVTEAPAKSGALITAEVAETFGRTVYAVPGSLDNPNAIGCLGAIDRGARLILGEQHLLEQLGAIDLTPGKRTPTRPAVLTPAQPTPAQPTLEPDLDRVFQVITGESIAFEAIVQKVGMDAGTVSGLLIQLELLGAIAQLPGMRYSRC
jgi:DNA processing protein